MIAANTPYIYTTQLHLKSFKLKLPSKYVIADKFLKNAIINHWEVAAKHLELQRTKRTVQINALSSIVYSILRACSSCYLYSISSSFEIENAVGS